MNASKENARHALKNLSEQERFMNAYAFGFIQDFLTAAERKLPSEEAYDRAEAKRKRKPKAK